MSAGPRRDATFAPLTAQLIGEAFDALQRAQPITTWRITGGQGPESVHIDFELRLTAIGGVPVDFLVQQMLQQPGIGAIH